MFARRYRLCCSVRIFFTYSFTRDMLEKFPLSTNQPGAALTPYVWTLLNQQACKRHFWLTEENLTFNKDSCMPYSCTRNKSNLGSLVLLFEMRGDISSVSITANVECTWSQICIDQQLSCNIVPFPDLFKMIGGNDSQSRSALLQIAVSYTCDCKSRY